MPETKKLKNEVLTFVAVLLHEDIPFMLEVRLSTYAVLVHDYRIVFDSTGNLSKIYEKPFGSNESARKLAEVVK